MKRSLLRLIFNDYIYCSIFVAVLIGIISIIPINHEMIDPFKEALADFEITDLGFTELRAEDPIADTNIVIVNIGKTDRAELATIINNLNQYKPAVIGLNIIINKSEDLFGDSLLAYALRNVDNVVYASKLSQNDNATNQWNQIETSDSVFMKFDKGKIFQTGFKNMTLENNDFKTTRHFFERASLNGVQQDFFSVELIKVIAPKKVEKFMARANPKEVINYRGNIEKFTILDVDQVLNSEFDPSLIKNKILILGYLGESLSNEKFWDDDKLYTPLNKKYAGKTFPDMFETVIFANIASQIMSDKHIEVVSDSTNIMLNILICFLNVVLFSMLFSMAAVWWDAFSLVITLIETVLLMLATALVFSLYRIEVNINLSIVFVLVLGTFLELYYGLFKIAIQKYTVKYRIAREDKKRRMLQDLVSGQTTNLMNSLLTDLNPNNDKTAERNTNTEDLDNNILKF